MSQLTWIGANMSWTDALKIKQICEDKKSKENLYLHAKCRFISADWCDFCYIDLEMDYYFKKQELNLYL